MEQNKLFCPKPVIKCPKNETRQHAQKRPFARMARFCRVEPGKRGNLTPNMEHALSAMEGL
jgi:hypothetical protein